MILRVREQRARQLRRVNGCSLLEMIFSSLSNVIGEEDRRDGHDHRCGLGLGWQIGTPAGSGHCSSALPIPVIPQDGGYKSASDNHQI